MPKKNQESEQLSLEEIESQLAQMESARQALESALKQRRAAGLTELAAEIRERIAERGYSEDEVLALFNKGKRAAPDRRGTVQYARYADPDAPERTYSRGPLPAWLREKMAAAGYDAADKTHREEFKASHLQRVA